MRPIPSPALSDTGGYRALADASTAGCRAAGSRAAGLGPAAASSSRVRRRVRVPAQESSLLGAARCCCGAAGACVRLQVVGALEVDGARGQALGTAAGTAGARPASGSGALPLPSKNVLKDYTHHVLIELRYFCSVIEFFFLRLIQTFHF